MTGWPRFRSRGLHRLVLTGVLGVAMLAPARRVAAWDPATTHAAMLERSVLDSALHVRMMEGSELRRGLFSSVRVNPRFVTGDQRRRITIALRHAHAAMGAAGRGGPGACPGAGAPPKTRIGCVEGDRWELSAIGWMQLGVVMEAWPRDRLLHHFADLEDPGKATFAQSRLPKVVLRREAAKAGTTPAEVVSGHAFSGEGPSALAWIDDPVDPLAPKATLRHLREASLAASAEARDAHLALGLVGLGALLHVVHDLSAPAHARGDVAAMFAPLSRIPGDRGLPLAELVRVEYGRRSLPGLPNLSWHGSDTAIDTRGRVLASSIRGHLLGEGDFEGLVITAGHRFLSEATLPSRQRIESTKNAADVAAELLAGSGLLPAESEGATLTAWPAEAGYVISRTQRPLAAYEIDNVGQVHLWLDRTVLRDQAGHMVPKGVEVGRSILDLLRPAFPVMDAGADGRLTLDLTDWDHADPHLRVMVEDKAGQRRTVRRFKLRPTGRQVLPALPPIPEGGRIVLVILAQRGGLDVTTEFAIGTPREDEAAGVPSPMLPGGPPMNGGALPPSGEPPSGPPKTGPEAEPKPGSEPAEGEWSEPDPVDEAEAGETEGEWSEPDPVDEAEKKPPPSKPGGVPGAPTDPSGQPPKRAPIATPK